MNKKLFKMPILFALILCICFVFVGCNKRKAPEGVSQDLYDGTLAFLDKIKEYYKIGNYKKVQQAYEDYKIEYSPEDNPGKDYSKEEKRITDNLDGLITYCELYLKNSNTHASFFNNQIREYTDKLSKALNLKLIIETKDNKIIIEEIE
ncbi:MAG TPA: hypothetical protein GXX63_02295 [Tissierellia bacterium]|nr:hypothetical protein [Tissierellia bacterium]